jgi:hypothetical protein
MSSCRRASQLISEGMNRKLSLSERLACGVHLLVCRACRTYKRQLEVLREAMKLHGPAMDELPHDSPNAALSPMARERIRRALNSLQ